jgi:hypothetical protein
MTNYGWTKKILDDGILIQEEYDAKKKKILEQDE